MYDSLIVSSVLLYNIWNLSNYGEWFGKDELSDEAFLQFQYAVFDIQEEVTTFSFKSQRETTILQKKYRDTWSCKIFLRFPPPSSPPPIPPQPFAQCGEKKAYAILLATSREVRL